MAWPIGVCMVHVPLMDCFSIFHTSAGRCPKPGVVRRFVDMHGIRLARLGLSMRSVPCYGMTQLRRLT